MRKFNLKYVLIASALFPVLGAQAQQSEFVPEGYKQVWADEFNDATPDGKPHVRPDKGDWWYETGGHGWGNNEKQYYVAGITGTDTLAAIKDGNLTIKLIKKAIGTNPYASVRMNTTQAWKYGYFEMRAKMPSGRGTWPAFWMLPKDFKSWPLDGEIDIMEYVGYEPNVVHGTIHTQAYNHSIGTQRGTKRSIQNAETEFHTYALLWTPEKIRVYVDGYNYFTFSNDEAGNKNTWPFNVPFYLKLNLAMGGNWGGAQGIDETITSASYVVDYVRVYQLATGVDAAKGDGFSSNFNQVDSCLTLLFSNEAHYQVQIVDMQGRTLERLSFTEPLARIDCSHLNPGHYLVAVTDGQNQYKKKFVKM
jgi:beta-glucanase (GH16 family)